MRHLIIDAQNMFNRAIHVTKGDAFQRGSLSLHIILMSISQAWKMFDAEHVVLCLESRTRDNWRRSIDERYKANRQALKDSKTPRETEDMDVLYEMFNDFLNFVNEQTNVSVLQCSIAEADDMLARWIALHPDDEHIMVSSDKDFYQLLDTNVIQFNGISKTIFSTEDSPLREAIRDKLPYDWKHEIIDDPEYVLFEKIIRGDSGDNVFSAWPGVRKKAGAGKPSISMAYADRHDKGFDWNNFMQHKWTDHNGKDHLVRDTFERNRKLVGLMEHPEDVKNVIDTAIINTLLTSEKKDKIGFNFMKFCHNNELEKMLDNIEPIARILSASYPVEKLTDESS